MRALRWLPLAYFADAHGFALFAPYAATIVMIYHVHLWLRRRVQVAA
jgi:hypothetical protein